MKTLNKETAKEIGFDIDQLHPETKYVAQDKDEWWFEFEYRPKKRNTYWDSLHPFRSIKNEPTNFKGHWTESLFKIERE